MRILAFRRSRGVAVLLLVLALCTGAQEGISPERLRAHVEYLASPKMQGRGTGTKELEQAARYIEKQFRTAGLETAAGKSFYQPFLVTVGSRLGKNNRAEAAVGKEKLSLRVREDFLPLNFSDTGEATVDVMFAGFGISAQEPRYDDYLHMDATGRAVIVLAEEPQKNDAQSPFAGRQPTQHSMVVNKAINARNHGAKVMVLVSDEPGKEEAEAQLKFGGLTGPENAGIMIIHATRVVVDRWLASSGKSLSQLQKEIDARLQPQSFYVPDVKLSVRVDVQRIRKQTENVAGILRGSDPKLKDEAIVIGAHYDHLGLGRSGGSLAPSLAGTPHLGADDNASGTSVLLELARVLSARRAELRRSVVFLAFSGEELGLLGSSYYTKNPLWPLEKTAAMINLDMVGRPKDGKLTVGGMGTSPIFKEVIEAANQNAKLQLSFQQSGYGSSDHSSFYVKDLPVLFFFSGLHADYHKPSDTADKILYADSARVGDLAMRVALDLASRDARPQFVKVQEERPAGGGGTGGYGAYFGSIPDMGEEVKGVKFADVREGSPAAKAGLKAGDVLIEFAGKPIQNLYDFTFALREHRPGETVQVTVLRDKEKMTVPVKLEQRR
jgi:hypothetical protein